MRDKWIKQELPPLSIAPLLLYLIVLLGLPFGVLVVTSFWHADFFIVTREFTLDNYRLLLEDPLFLRLIGRSIWIGCVVSLVTLPFAFVLAYAITFAFKTRSSTLLMLVMISMLSSYLVRVYAWKTILGPHGLINQILMASGLISEPLTFLLYGDFALVLTLTHILIPYAVLSIYASLQGIDEQYLEAARDLGSSGLRTFLTIILPLAKPGLVAAFLFSFVLASADYVTPQLVGGTSGMLIGRTIADQFGMAGNPPFGAVLSIALIAAFGLVIGGLVLLSKPLGAIYRQLIKLVGNRPSKKPYRRPGTSGSSLLVEVLAILVLLFLFTPLFILVAFSFNASPSGAFPIRDFSLQWYRELFGSTTFMRAIRSSLLVAALTIIGTLILAVPSAFALARHKFVLRPVVIAFIVGPLLVPGIVIGTGTLATLGLFEWHGGLVPTVLVHILFTVPFVVMILSARLAAFDWQMLEAGRDLGSSALKAFIRIVLPIIAPALLGSGILVAALSLDEFVITNFVIGANTTLPVYIWGQMRTGITPSVNAIASVILISSVLLLALFDRLVGDQLRSSSLSLGSDDIGAGHL